MPVVLLIFCIISTSFATSLVNRFQYITTETLPDGVWTFGVAHGKGLGAGNQFYGPNGASVSNQQYFSKSISYNNLLDEINNPLEKELAAAAFDAYEREGNSSAGLVMNDVSVEQSSNTYVLGRGFGERHSMFLIFPVVTIDTSFKSSFRHSDSLMALANELKAQGQYLEASKILEKSQNALSERLRENGYNQSYPESLTTLANVYLGHRYRILPAGKFRLTTDSNLVIPAGHKSDKDDFIYLRINEEQFSFKQGLNAAYRTDNSFIFLSSIYYHKRFSFERGMRIPRNNVSPLSNEYDPDMKMKYGDTYGGSLQVNYPVTESIVLYTGQTYEMKDRDSASGNKFEPSRYDYLESRTSQKLLVTYAGLTLNSIKSFLAQEFPIPVEMNLQYSKTSSGKNTFRNEAIAMNMMVFYK